MYYYLKPAHIDASVRHFINEEIEVSINKISNLKDILEDHPNNIGKFVEHLAGFCKPNTLSVQDLIQYANRFFAQHKKPIEKQVKTFASRSGKDALKIEVSTK
ncbi:hypothetical protein RZS08_05185, partial [Arthrospira platensis SPKY1]|nr:hypothetical protein [Arthrospira platensis SPKY1]